MSDHFEAPITNDPIPKAAPPALRVDRRLLEILVCPVTRGPLEYIAGSSLLVSRQAGLAYPIRDGIPIMLADEAMPWPSIDAPHIAQNIDN